jgi:hypothetical protein
MRKRCPSGAGRQKSANGTTNHNGDNQERRQIRPPSTVLFTIDVGILIDSG